MTWICTLTWLSPVLLLVLISIVWEKFEGSLFWESAKWLLVFVILLLEIATDAGYIRFSCFITTVNISGYSYSSPFPGLFTVLMFKFGLYITGGILYSLLPSMVVKMWKKFGNIRHELGIHKKLSVKKLRLVK